MAKFIVVDGNSIMNRAFYGLSGRNMLANKEGIPTNALYGFLNILFKLLKEDNPEYIAVAFDLKAPTFRHIKYTEYKANRKGMPEELVAQMPIIREILDAMNICRIELEGFEADDILGTLAKKSKEEGHNVTIFTGDRDSFQLIEDKIHVKLPLTKAGKTETEEYDVKKIKEKYGVMPIDLIQVKALMGDNSDNIPGVRGIGEKTALSYIQKFGTLERVYENLDSNIIKPKARELLEQYKSDAFMSRELATIELSVPIDFNMDKYKVNEYDNEKLYNIFLRLEFINFIKKLELKSSNKAEQVVITDAETIETYEKLKQSIESEKFLAFYIERINELKSAEEINRIFISTEQKNFVVKIKNFREDALKYIFENEKFEKAGAETKNLYVIFNRMGIKIENLICDLSIAKYVINSSYNNYTVEKMAEDDLNITFSESHTNSQISMFGNSEPEEDKSLYSRAVLELYKKYIKIIKENGQEKLFYDIEMPLVKVLADMQIAGVEVDKKLLTEYGLELNRKMNNLVQDVYSIAGEEFNINSPKQLGEVLFEKLNLKAGKKNQRGYSTDAETLEKLREEHPIVEKILEYKQYAKIKSTYIDGLIATIDEKTKRIHSNFNQTITSTGRLSSTEPNLQNIPVRTEAGKIIRKMFIAREGSVFIDADYSQIELRVLAHMANERIMIEAFNNDEDIHTSTAMQIFHLDKEEVTPALRSQAKTVNFGIIYGQSEFSLGEELKIGRNEAKAYIESYFEHFPGIKEYMQEIVKTGKEKGYVETMYARRRYLPDLSSSNFHIRSFAERAAMNMPIQGSAADIIKIAMIMVSKKLAGMKSKLILQVHDEIIVEATEDESARVIEIIKESMENAVKLNVKLKADINTGKNWLEAK